MNRFCSVVLLVVLIPVVFTCTTRGTDGDGQGMNGTVQNVTIEIVADTFPGTSLNSFLTPVKLRISNASDKPLRIRYDNFALIGPDGQYFAALPVYNVSGTEPALAEQYPPIASPDLQYKGFFIAPYYTAVYTNLPAYTAGTFYYDESYYNAYGNYWNGREVPLSKMRGRVIPEGVLQPGGNVSGYLYFERLDTQRTNVFFSADLVNAATGAFFGYIGFKFNPSSTDNS